VDTLEASGGQLEKVSVRGLAKLLGVSKSTVHNALAALAASGVVVRLVDGGLSLRGC
jgi:DNA-binding GntR family transcriptional regulator